MKTTGDSDDPFSPEADPYPPAIDSSAAGSSLQGEEAAAKHECRCGPRDALSLSLSRRQALTGAALAALSPWVAQAETLVPCVQVTQKPQPCRHKFCRYYAGDGDYHGR